MIKNLLFILFIKILLRNSYSTIVIPLESLQSISDEDLDNNSESKALINQLFNMNLVSTIKIGSESYPLKAFFNLNSPFFYISKNCFIVESSSFNFKINFNYNRHISQSFYNTSLFDKSFGTNSHACTAMEDFQFLTHDKKEMKVEKINFILNEDTNEKEPNCLHIGLIENQNKESSFNDMNLVIQLKQKDYIKGYIWSIIFSNEKMNNNNLLNDVEELLNLKGNMIIGDYPHEYDSNNFYESQFKHIYTLYNENIIKWELKFNKIYFKNRDNKEQKIDDYNAIFNPSIYYIKAPKAFFEILLDDYFQQYIEKEACSLYYLDEYISINCDKSDKFSIKDLKSFPTLYLEHISFEYTFELSYKDLFVEKDNIYWFLIISDTLFYTTGWTLGNIFMKNYQFTFNLETKEIGFYNPKLDKINNNKNERYGEKTNNILYIVLIVALVIILIGIGFIIKMKFYTKISKKKRANELDDDYEYIIDKKNNNIGQNDDNNKLFNNS